MKTREVQLKDLKAGSKFMFLKDETVFILFFSKDWRNSVGYATDETKKLKESHCSAWVREIIQ